MDQKYAQDSDDESSSCSSRMTAPYRLSDASEEDPDSDVQEVLALDRARNASLTTAREVSEKARVQHISNARLQHISASFVGSSVTISRVMVPRAPEVIQENPISASKSSLSAENFIARRNKVLVAAKFIAASKRSLENSVDEQPSKVLCTRSDVPASKYRDRKTSQSDFDGMLRDLLQLYGDKCPCCLFTSGTADEMCLHFVDEHICSEFTCPYCRYSNVQKSKTRTAISSFRFECIQHLRSHYVESLNEKENPGILYTSKTDPCIKRKSTSVDGSSSSKCLKLEHTNMSSAIPDVQQENSKLTKVQAEVVDTQPLDLVKHTHEQNQFQALQSSSPMDVNPLKIKPRSYEEFKYGLSPYTESGAVSTVLQTAHFNKRDTKVGMNTLPHTSYVGNNVTSDGTLVGSNNASNAANMALVLDGNNAIPCGTPVDMMPNHVQTTQMNTESLYAESRAAVYRRMMYESGQLNNTSLPNFYLNFMQKFGQNSSAFDQNLQENPKVPMLGNGCESKESTDSSGFGSCASDAVVREVPVDQYSQYQTMFSYLLSYYFNSEGRQVSQ